MNRQAFLHRLERRLSAYFTPAETDDILAAYNKRFDAGIAEGRSEEELCARLGDPPRIVAALVGERRGRPLGRRYLFLSLFTTLLLPGVALAFFYDAIHFHWLSPVYAALAPLLLLWARTGRSPRLSETGHRVSLVTGCTAGLLFALPFAALWRLLSELELWKTLGYFLWPSLPLDRLGPILSSLFLSAALLGATAWLLCAVSAPAGPAGLAAFLWAGVAAASHNFYLLTCRLDDPAAFVRFARAGLRPLALDGLLFAAALLWSLRRTGPTYDASKKKSEMGGTARDEQSQNHSAENHLG